MAKNTLTYALLLADTIAKAHKSNIDYRIAELEAATIRKEKQLEREHEESQLYLKTTIEQANAVQKNIDTLTNTSVELGVYDQARENFPEVDKTEGGANLSILNKEDLENRLTDLRGIEGSLKTTLTDFYEGYNRLWADLDLDDTGIVEEREFSAYAEFNPNPLSEAHIRGIKARNYEPSKAMELGLQEIKLGVEKLKFAALPGQITRGHGLDDINIDLGNMKLEDWANRQKNWPLETNYLLEQTKNLELDIQLKEIQIKQLDEPSIDEVKDLLSSIGQNEVTNLQNIQEAGAKVISSLTWNSSSWRNDTPVIKTMDTLITSVGADLEKFKEELTSGEANRSFMLIGKDILDMYTKYTSAVATGGDLDKNVAIIDILTEAGLSMKMYEEYLKLSNMAEKAQLNPGSDVSALRSRLGLITKYKSDWRGDWNDSGAAQIKKAIKKLNPTDSKQLAKYAVIDYEEADGTIVKISVSSYMEKEYGKNWEERVLAGFEWSGTGLMDEGNYGVVLRIPEFKVTMQSLRAKKEEYEDKLLALSLGKVIEE